MFKSVKNASFILTITLIFLVFNYTVSAGSEIKVIPMGKAVGVKIYTEGLLVVGISENSPSKSSPIKVNDRIERANNQELTSSEQLCEIVNNCSGNLTLTVNQDGKQRDISVAPQKDSEGVYKLGLWVRDSTAGIGTMTYYNPKNNTFAALGHGINDVDTGNILTVKSGNILPCKILSVRKSENGNPGELNGIFDGSAVGEIFLNSDNGIYGKCSLDAVDEAIPVADANEVHEGGAYILADINGGGAKQYSIEIIKIAKGNKSHKNMVISITDPALLSLTGGIVQGMSGAPIIQDNKLAGALTHVFINDSDRGYGTFAEDMIEISENIE